MSEQDDRWVKEYLDAKLKEFSARFDRLVRRVEKIERYLKIDGAEDEDERL